MPRQSMKNIITHTFPAGMTLNDLSRFVSVAMCSSEQGLERVDGNIMFDGRIKALSVEIGDE